jgi:hypothetical protein
MNPLAQPLRNMIALARQSTHSDTMPRRRMIDDAQKALDAAKAALSANAEPPEWPECSGDPACCPENEGYGCCKPNPAIPEPPTQGGAWYPALAQVREVIATGPLVFYHSNEPEAIIRAAIDLERERVAKVAAKQDGGQACDTHVATVDEADDGLFVELRQMEGGNPVKFGDKLYLRPPVSQGFCPAVAWQYQHKSLHGGDWSPWYPCSKDRYDAIASSATTRPECQARALVVRQPVPDAVIRQLINRCNNHPDDESTAVIRDWLRKVSA